MPESQCVYYIIFYAALEGSNPERNNPTLLPLMRSVLLRKLNMELLNSLNSKSVISAEAVQPVRNTILELASIPDETYNELFENCVAALINRSDFEFLMVQITDPR